MFVPYSSNVFIYSCNVSILFCTCNKAQKGKGKVDQPKKSKKGKMSLLMRLLGGEGNVAKGVREKFIRVVSVRKGKLQLLTGCR